MIHNTPLRYPGGKAKLGGFIRSVFVANSFLDGHYAEPYAGGAGIAFELLFYEQVSRVHLNDIDRSVYCFWKAVLYQTEALCKRILDTAITVATWKQQKQIFRDIQSEDLDLAFAFFFLNRTNRSGILNGGIIGGLDQKGAWKIDARFNRKELIRRIQKIAAYRSRISLYNMDAADFIKTVVPSIIGNMIVYFDPPYYLKGGHLYKNYYKPKDHKAISQEIQNQINKNWIVSYDDVAPIIKLYSQRRRARYSLSYSAAKKSTGSEVMFFSDRLKLPDEMPRGFRVFCPKPKLIKDQSLHRINA